MGKRINTDRFVENESSRIGTPWLIYDGDCSFCLLWIDRWRSLTGDRVRYEPFQSLDRLGTDPERSRMGQRFADALFEIPRENFAKAVQLVLPSGEMLSGAGAALKTLAYAPGRRSRWFWLYKNVPGFRWVSELFYSFIASHRPFFYKLTVLLWGKNLERSTFILSRWLFLRILGVIYFIAFVSFWLQIGGLIGSNGILPANNFLQVVSENVGSERYFTFPTLAWLSASDGFLQFLGLGGAFLSLLLILGFATVPVLVLLFVFYLSLVTVGQVFMTFQWDIFLLEVGFLSIFFASLQILPKFSRESSPSRVVRWLFWLLLFKFVFQSGVVKLLSGDKTWRNLTALKFHYETQPLPTPLAWFVHQLPLWLDKLSVIFMFGIELVVPFLIFAPRRLRFVAAGSIAALEVLILLTGNYTFFNLLTITLCLLLLDDALLARFFPKQIGREIVGKREKRKTSLLRRVIVGALAVVIISLTVVQMGAQFSRGRILSRPVAQALGKIAPFHVVNNYGLFAVMTTSRPEIVVQGSIDGEAWEDYEFKYKPGAMNRAPPIVAPHQPRLDWQMWFAALGSYERNPWFVNFMTRLLQGSPEVLALLDKNPFPLQPPRYVRAVLYDYRFTSASEKKETGAWWGRELKGLYFPQATLSAGG